jgi:hypothetical protein
MALAAPSAMASTVADIAELLNVETTNVRRDALVDALALAPFGEVVPRILPLIREYATPTEPGMGAKPWLSDEHSVRARIWYALGAIWDRHLTGAADPAKGAVLLSLLDADGSPQDMSRLIEAVGFHWTSDSEPLPAALLKRRSVPAEVRVAAAGELLRRASIDRYVPSAVALVREAEPARRSERYNRLANMGYDVRSASPASRAALVDVGFELLEAEQYPAARYFLAIRIGFLLDVPGEFKPDNRDPRYKGPNGLTQEFFDQTVRNALAWRKGR